MANASVIKQKQSFVNDETYACNSCRKRYPNLEQCLAHEILEHELRVGIRQELRSAFNSYQPGQELDAIIDFFLIDNSKLRKICDEVINNIKTAVGNTNDYEIHVYGSMVTNLMMRSSDIDLYVQYDRKWAQMSRRTCVSILNGISHRLRSSKHFENIFFIRKASVPIIKFRHVASNFDIDLNVSCPSSIQNNVFVLALLDYDKRLRQLVTFIKIWAKETNIIGKGNLTSYGIIMLAIFYLQNTKDPKSQLFLVPSVQQMQLKETPVYVQGGNFGFNISDNMNDWSPTVTALDLIKGFFVFYNNFRFDEFIISPYLGKCVEVKSMATGSYCFPAYEEQRKRLRDINGEEPIELALDREICVQDPFFLNHNITKAVVRGNLRFIKKWLQRACSVCERADTMSVPKFYEVLLFGNETFPTANASGPKTKQNNQQQDAPKQEATFVQNNPSETNKFPHHTLVHALTPCRSELKSIVAHFKDIDDSSLYYSWTKVYTAAIKKIITDIYGLDIQMLSPTNRSKQQKLDYNDRSTQWCLSGTVDLWTGRSHEKTKNVPFMQYQMAQTEKLLKERKQNTAYATQLQALLAINISKDNKTIELQIQKSDDENKVTPNNMITRNDCVRKFFSMLKCSLQNFNIKEWLATEETDWQSTS